MNADTESSDDELFQRKRRQTETLYTSPTAQRATAQRIADWMTMQHDNASPTPDPDTSLNTQTPEHTQHSKVDWAVLTDQLRQQLRIHEYRSVDDAEDVYLANVDKYMKFLEAAVAKADAELMAFRNGLEPEESMRLLSVELKTTNAQLTRKQPANTEKASEFADCMSEMVPLSDSETPVEPMDQDPSSSKPMQAH